MCVNSTALDLRQRIEGVPQTKEQLLAIHEFLGAGLVQAGGIFDPIVTIQGIISLVVARPFRMGGFAPPTGHELLGHFVRNLCVFIVGVPRVKVFQIDGRHIQNIHSNIIQTLAAKIGGRFYPDAGIHIDWIYANRQPNIAHLVRPEQFKIRALPQMFRKDFLYSLNFMFLFFCVKHFCVLLDKNFGVYHHQFSTRRLRLSVCHIC